MLRVNQLIHHPIRLLVYKPVYIPKFITPNGCMKKRLYFLMPFTFYFLPYAYSQSVGIGTTTPDTSATLHVDLQNSMGRGFLVSGQYNYQSTVPNLGAGSRMMFYPGKAAFRAGFIEGTEWNNANVGNYSIAMGYNTTASGPNSTALGYSSTASAYTSTAIGYATTASNSHAVAMGYATKATGTISTAMGMGTTSSSHYTTAMGSYTIASGYGSTAMGAFSQATARYSIAAGYKTHAKGEYSTTSGYENVAKGYASTVIGLYNDSLLTTDEENVHSDTPLFIVGNGTTNTQRSNALVVRKSGAIQAKNDITVQNGKGLIRSNDGTQLKKLSANVQVSVTLAGGATTAINVTWPEAFSNVPEAYVGNVVSGTGGWAEATMTIAEVTAIGAKLYVHNPRTNSFSPNFTIKVIAMGAQ